MSEYNLSDIGVVKKLLFDAGFSFKKSLGQNFLINPAVCPDMAKKCGCDGVGVLEIGVGIGVLTAELCKRAKKVVCVEIDRRLEAVLNESLADYDNYEIVWQDFMKLDAAAFLKEKFGDMPVVVCANLPYYITSPVIMRLLEERLPIDAITVMVQREAAQRLTAKVGSREAGAVTVAVNYYAEAEVLRQVSRGSFMPSPNVDSSVIKLTLRKQPPVEIENEELFFKIVRAGFAQRRKTLVNAVSSALHFPKPQLEAALTDVRLSKTVRADGMTMQQLADFCNAVCKIGDN